MKCCNKPEFRTIVPVLLLTALCCGQDRDGDGIPDTKDVFPDDPSAVMDSDNDRKADSRDPFPNDYFDGALKNLALQAKVTASSVARPVKDPQELTDGRFTFWGDDRKLSVPNSSWQPKKKTKEWAILDLGSPQEINHIRVTFGMIASPHFELLTSMDRQKWSSAAEVKNEVASIDVPVQKTTCRYVKFLIHAGEKQSGWPPRNS